MAWPSWPCCSRCTAWRGESGSRRAVAACSAALLSTFSLVALESMTAQNDLVAASFPAVAACLILGGSSVELVLAGAALGLGLGTKLSTAFVWPALALLAWPMGRRAYLRILAGASVSFAPARSLGILAEPRSYRAACSAPGFETDVGVCAIAHEPRRRPFSTSSTGCFDVSVISNRLIVRLAVVGVIAALLIGVQRSRRSGACCVRCSAPAQSRFPSPPRCSSSPALHLSRISRRRFTSRSRPSPRRALRGGRTRTTFGLRAGRRADAARHTGAGCRHVSRQACRYSISGARARVAAFPRAARRRHRVQPLPDAVPARACRSDGAALQPCASEPCGHRVIARDREFRRRLDLRI